MPRTSPTSERVGRSSRSCGRWRAGPRRASRSETANRTGCWVHRVAGLAGPRAQRTCGGGSLLAAKDAVERHVRPGRKHAPLAGRGEGVVGDRGTRPWAKKRRVRRPLSLGSPGRSTVRSANVTGGIKLSGTPRPPGPAATCSRAQRVLRPAQPVGVGVALFSAMPVMPAHLSPVLGAEVEPARSRRTVDRSQSDRPCQPCGHSSRPVRPRRPRAIASMKRFGKAPDSSSRRGLALGSPACRSCSWRWPSAEQRRR